MSSMEVVLYQDHPPLSPYKAQFGKYKNVNMYNISTKDLIDYVAWLRSEIEITPLMFEFIYFGEIELEHRTGIKMVPFHLSGAVKRIDVLGF